MRRPRRGVSGLDPDGGGDRAEVFGSTHPMGSGVTRFSLYISLFSGPSPSGKFNAVEGLAPEHIFADGFGSGDSRAGPAARPEPRGASGAAPPPAAPSCRGPRSPSTPPGRQPATSA